MIYDTDQIILYPITRDSVYGTITEGTAVTYDCVLEDTNIIIKNENGQQIKPNALILVDNDFAGVKGDMIQLYSKFDVLTGDTKKYEIIEIMVTGGLMASHKEVII